MQTKGLDLNRYSTFVFDMDGLILNSLAKLNDSIVKSVSEFTNSTNLENFAQYSFNHPGISRYDKFKYFFTNIEKSSQMDRDLQIALANFESLAINARMQADLSSGFIKVANRFLDKKLILSTNCSNSSIHEILAHHKISHLFGEYVYGTPPSKLNHALDIKNTAGSGLVLSISDSLPDLQCADSNGFDFLFVEEFANDKGEWVPAKHFKIDRLSSLLEI